MFIPEKKRAVAMILAGKHKEPQHFSEGGQPKEDSEDSDMSSHLEAKAAHASTIIGALHNKDPHEFVAAMDRYLTEHQLHQDKKGEDESDYTPNK